MAKLDTLIEKLMTDRAFASALVSDPEKTLKDNGVEPTPEMVAALQGLDAAALERLAGAFGKAAAGAAA